MIGLVLLCLVGISNAASTGAPYSNWCWEGRACASDNDCKQPNGQSSHCCQGECRQLPLNRGDICNATAGCPGCGPNLKCQLVGSPAMNKCVQDHAFNGCLCNSTGGTGNGGCLSGDCLLTGLCGATQVFPGGSCEQNNQCVSNNCTNGTCAVIRDGDKCTIGQFGCGTNSTCLSTSNCGPVIQAGAACKQDYECVQPGVCSNLICVAYRTLPDNATCTDPLSCISGNCGGGVCKPMHYLAAGSACTSDDQCPWWGVCDKNTCSGSAFGMACDPTTSKQDLECMGSKDLVCACSGQCLPADAATGPVNDVGATDPCQQAIVTVSKFFKDLSRVDFTGLTTDQRTAIATSTCCRNCRKDLTVSRQGYQADCATKTVTAFTVDCSAIADADPPALLNCPNPHSPTASFVAALGPSFVCLLALVASW